MPEPTRDLFAHKIQRQDHSYIVSPSEDPFSGDQSDSEIGSIFDDVTSNMDHTEQKASSLSGLISPVSDHEHGLRPRSAKRRRCFSNSSIASEESEQLLDWKMDSTPPKSGENKRPHRVGRPRKSLDSNSRCMSKNAIAARENREKKKAYIHSLESQLKSLREENEQLKGKNRNTDSYIEQLCREVTQLRSIISNVPQIRQLIPTIQSSSSVILKSEKNSPASEKFHRKHGFGKVKTPFQPVGVCLHLETDGHISIEFCSVCSKSSSGKNCSK